MEVDTQIYSIPSKDEPFELLMRLMNGYYNIGDMLGLKEEDIPPANDYFENLEQYPIMDQISDDVMEQLAVFALDTLGIEQLPEFYYDPNEDTLYDLLELRKLLHEQLDYYVMTEEGCNVWFIVSSINGHPYGGVFAFQNKKYPKTVMIQAISKFFIPSLFNLLYPEESEQLPKLNSLLQPSLETLAKQIGASEIVVVPIGGKQGPILEKYYGYHKVPKVFYPCKEIRGSSMLSGESRTGRPITFYSKNIH